MRAIKGTYTTTLDGERWTTKFEEKGTFTVTRGGNLAVEGTYKVMHNEVEMTDESGPIACTGDYRTGRYKWKLEGKQLTFIESEDECEGRMEALTTNPWDMQD